MNKYLIIFAIFFGCLVSNQIEATCFNAWQIQIKQRKMDSISIYQNKLAGFNGKNIAYTIYSLNSSLNKKSKGAVVISPGFGEASEKYLEVAYDLLMKGMGPIYVIDHRGQGRSGTLSKNGRSTHIDRWEYMVEDFATFMDEVVLVREKDNLFLISHSMGGLISSDYLAQGKVFKKVVMVAPMFLPNLKGRSLFSAKLLVGFKALFGNKENFVINAREYSLFQRERVMKVGNSDENRYKINTQIFEDNPSYKRGGASWGWVREVFHGHSRVKQQVDRITDDILLLQAGNEKVVDNEEQDTICSLLPNCRIEVIRDGKHDLLNEIDVRRNQVLSLIEEHFKI